MRSLDHFYLLLLIFNVSHVDGRLKKYVSLISDVHKFYGTSSVFFISSHNDQSIEEYTLVHVLSRDFSRKGVLTLIINFEELDERSNFYRKRVARPLIVVLLKMVSDIAEFNENTRDMNISYPIWLVIFANEFGAPMCEYCNRPMGNVFDLRFDTEMLVMCCQNSTLKEWWCDRKNHTEMAEFATWIENKGFTVLSKDGLYTRRPEVSGSPLRIAFVTNSAFLRLNGSTVDGFFGRVLSDLQLRMNFTITAKVKENGFGSWNPGTGSWTGVVGQLAQGKADIGVAEFTITKDRLSVVDFTLPIVLSRNRLYIREPDGSRVQWSAYFKAFTFEIWMTIVVIMITTPILLTMIKMKGGSNLLPCLFIQNYIYVWGIFCQQGLSEFPAETPLRVAYFSIFVSALVVSAAYSASLISFLTVSSPGLPFTTMEGFVSDGTYKLIVYQNSSDYDLFAVSNDTVLSDLMKLMKPWQELPTTLEQGFGQVCREKVAFYTTEAGKQTLNIRLPCKIVAIDSGRTDSLAMIMPVDSQYTGVVNYHIQRFQDNGMLNRLKNQYFIKGIRAATTYDVVTLGGVAPILAVLAGGIILACVIMFFEKSYLSRKNSARKSRPAADSIKLKMYRWFTFRGKKKSPIRKIQLPVDHLYGQLNNSTVGYYP